jgi:hypothetical protein
MSHLSRCFACLFLVVPFTCHAGTGCFTVNNRTANEVYGAAYHALSAEGRAGGGWDIADRADGEHRFAFQSFPSDGGWRGVSGTIVVAQGNCGAVMTVSTTRRSMDPGRDVGKARELDACGIALQVRRHLNFRGPIKCDERCYGQ